MQAHRFSAAVLARAFHTDAMFTYIEPDDQRRADVLPWFFGAAARLGKKYGRLDVIPGRAAAIWLPPGKTELGPHAIVGSGLALAPFRLGVTAFRRFGAITSAFDAAKSEVIEPPFWHLFILGVEPTEQGRGFGRRIIAPVLAQADRVGHRCYLETTEESNLAFYRRQGFEVASTHAPDGLPVFWTMTRQPG